MAQTREINLDQTSGVICTKCSSPFFKQVLLMRKVSRFITGDVEDAVIPVAVVACDNCGTLCIDALQPQVKAMLMGDMENQTPEPEKEQPGAKIIKMESR